MQRFEEAEAELSRFQTGLRAQQTQRRRRTGACRPSRRCYGPRSTGRSRRPVRLSACSTDGARPAASGYDRSFELLDGSSDTLGPSAKPSCGWHQIRFYDFGRTGGAAARSRDRSRRHCQGVGRWIAPVSLATHGPVLVDAGGDIRAMVCPAASRGRWQCRIRSTKHATAPYWH